MKHKIFALLLTAALLLGLLPTATAAGTPTLQFDTTHVWIDLATSAYASVDVTVGGIATAYRLEVQSDVTGLAAHWVNAYMTDGRNTLRLRGSRIGSGELVFRIYSNQDALLLTQTLRIDVIDSTPRLTAEALSVDLTPGTVRSLALTAAGTLPAYELRCEARTDCVAAECFTPDEEVGKGADHFDPEKFPARVAYTVDGGELGEIEYENFNAAAVTLTVEGVNIHPGSAKNKMKNAILLANQFISLLPAAEAPAHTEGYEGFYHVTDLAGNESQVVLHAIIRDHDLEKFNARKAFVQQLVDYLNARWGQGTFRLEMRDSYYNMKEKIRPHMELIENAKAAMEAVGVEPVIVPIRGGTDGARLSWEQDIPCPNLCTGGANYHGVHEFVPVPSMEKMVQVLVELVKA